MGFAFRLLSSYVGLTFILTAPSDDMSDELEPFPVTVRPKQAAHAVMLASLVHEILADESGSRERSQRTLKEDHVRASRTSIDKALRTLCGDGWLRVLPNRSPGRGNRYALGERFRKKSVLAAWQAIAERTFGAGGYLNETFPDALFAYGALGGPKLLVLAVVREHNHQLRPFQVEVALEGMFDRKSTKYHVKGLVEKGLLVIDSGLLRVSSDLDERIDQLREGFQHRVNAIVKRNEMERENFLLSTGTSSVLIELRKHFRGFPCVRCGVPSNSVEHFPPKKWTGEDDWFLTYPICIPCNRLTAQFIKRHKTPARLKVHREFRTVPDLGKSLEERLRALRDRFYRYVADGKDDEALRVAAKARAVFDAHTSERGRLVLRISDDKTLALKPGETPFPGFRHARRRMNEPISKEKPDPGPGLTRVPLPKKATPERSS